MKEKPILFNTEMVKAILEGRKTQSRRPVKGKIEYIQDNTVLIDGIKQSKSLFIKSKSPFGQIGDHLYVRETFAPFVPEHIIDDLCAYKADCSPDSDEIRREYIKCGYPYQWKPSIHMPKKYARIWLEITDIRVERVNDISQEDAKCEGVEIDYCDHVRRSCEEIGCRGPYGAPFSELWDSVYKNWDDNPWVWVIEFKRIEKC